MRRYLRLSSLMATEDYGPLAVLSSMMISDTSKGNNGRDRARASAKCDNRHRVVDCTIHMPRKSSGAGFERPDSDLFWPEPSGDSFRRSNVPK
jgi:hypothetical protein